MADVFISYSKIDRAIAESLAKDLMARGFDVWWDFQLYAGDDFHNEIRTELTKAKAAIVIWSKDAAASHWVRGEAQEALDNEKVIAAHIPGFATRDVPLNFRALHTVSVEDRDAIHRAIERKGVKARLSTSPRVVEPESSLIDTTWSVSQKVDGSGTPGWQSTTIWKFLRTGIITNDKVLGFGSGRWEQDGTSVLINLKRGGEYRGQIRRNTITGTYENESFKGTWEAKRIID